MGFWAELCCGLRAENNGSAKTGLGAKGRVFRLAQQKMWPEGMGAGNERGATSLAVLRLYKITANSNGGFPAAYILEGVHAE